MNRTGLGLAIVKEIAEAYGGTMRAASTLGNGSIFTVTLPPYRQPTVGSCVT